VLFAAEHLEDSPELLHLIADVRADTTGCIFLCGGAAARLPDASQQQLLHLLDALTLLAKRGLRFAVGDGGTQAGLMEAAGLARQASAAGGLAFPLIGVAPAREVTTALDTAAKKSADEIADKTPIDPHHSHIVAVRNDRWDEEQRARGSTPNDDYWGSETEAMTWIFNRLAEGRPSVALVANGGTITLDEVRANLAARRPIVLIAGSGRATDVLIASLTQMPADAPDRDESEDEDAALRARAEALGLASAPRDLYHFFDVHAGADALANLLAGLLSRR